MIFKLKDFCLTVAEVSTSEPLFLASDIAKSLGMHVKTISRFLKDNLRGKDYRVVPSGQGRPSYYVTEAGLYDLILLGKTEIARDFRYWVIDDVLPSIREYGVAIAPGITREQAIAGIDRILDTPSPWQLFYSQPVRDKFVGWFGIGFYWDFCYHWMTPEEICQLNSVNGDRTNRIHQHLSPEVKARLEPHIELLLNVADGFSDRQSFVNWYQGKYGKGWQMTLPLSLNA